LVVRLCQLALWHIPLQAIPNASILLVSVLKLALAFSARVPRQLQFPARPVERAGGQLFLKRALIGQHKWAISNAMCGIANRPFALPY